MAFLDEHAKEMVNKKGGQWSPLISYRNGLAGQDEEEEGTKKKRKENTTSEGRPQNETFLLWNSVDEGLGYWS